ncbi:hypothetical protein ACFOGI_03190 [Virgibacillus xinjiangensis]|uniref:Uncharacterized protein n=1 Tax=Virgibacillus xinjiangensis TaxID=393090 RepID=A0ABV7CSF2_9BACI
MIHSFFYTFTQLYGLNREIGRRRAESAGELAYRQEVRGIGGRAGISAGGARNRRESGDIGRRRAELAGELAYQQEVRGIGRKLAILAVRTESAARLMRPPHSNLIKRSCRYFPGNQVNKPSSSPKFPIH